MLDKVANRINVLTPSGIRAVSAKAAELEKTGVKVIHLELGRPDFDTPDYIKESAKKSLDEGRVFYTSNFGTDDLRVEICRKLLRDNNLEYSPSEVLVTVGLSEAIFCTLSTILEEGDEIIVPDPVWMNYINIPKLLGAKVETYSLLAENLYQPDIAEVESKITPKTKAIVINSPNNPTGSVLSVSALKSIAELAIKYNLIVLADEVYERIVYEGSRHISIATFPGMKEHTIVLNGFSKAYSMTGWRLGYLAGPEDMIRTINKMHQIVTTCATTFVQDAAAVALSNEGPEVEDMVKEYERRKKYLTDAINGTIGLSCVEPKGAFYVFVDISRTGMSDTVAAQFFLEKAHVAVVPGTVFGENGKNYIRISYAAGMDELRAAVEQIRGALWEAGIR